MNTVHSAETDDSGFIPSTEKPINVFSNQVILQIGSEDNASVEQIFPKILRHVVTKTDFSESDILSLFSERMDAKRINGLMCPESLMQTVQTVYRNYFARNRTFKIQMSQKILVDVRDLQEQNELIESIHVRAHRGIEENYAVMSKEYYFPTMKRKIQSFVSLCDICKRAKYDRKPYKIEFLATPLPEKPFDIVHIDIFISAPNLFLSAVDKLSKFGILIPIQSRSIPDVRRALTTLISTYGTPRKIVSDNEPAIRSVEIRQLMNDLGVEMHFTSVDHSGSNGIVERFHSTLAEIFRCNKSKYTDLNHEEIWNISVGLYNSTVHSVTKMKPMNIFFGQDRPTNLDILLENRNRTFDEVVARIQNEQRKTLEYHNRAREIEPRLDEDENVHLKVQGIKKKTRDKFRSVQVHTDGEKTFTDSQGRKLHKDNLRRK